jgi:hypothetical protein
MQQQEKIQDDPKPDTTDQELVDKLLKVFKEWATEVAAFAGVGELQKDGIITLWRLESYEGQAMSKAKSRSLTCDGDIENAFKRYVPRLKVLLTETDVAVYVSVPADQCLVSSPRL